MTAFEPYTGLVYLVTKLRQDVTLAGLVGQRVYRGRAKGAQAGPWVVISFVSANDRQSYSDGRVRIWTEIVFQVETWSRTEDPSVVAQIASRVDDVLQNSGGVITGEGYRAGTVWEVVRQQPLLIDPEDDGDVRYERAGGEYVMKVQSA